MADTTVTNLNEGKSNLITRTSNAITDIRRILNEPAAKRALPTALALIVTFIGIILFTFTIIQGMGADVLVLNGIFDTISDSTLVPKLINLMSKSAPWLVGLLAVCALAAMQSTGSAYMSTFSAMITRDIYKNYFDENVTEERQKLIGRIFVVVVAVAALFVAIV